MAGAVFLAVVLFFYLPMAVVVANSFNVSRYGTQWLGFTWGWYDNLFRDRSLWEASLNTLLVGGVASLASVVLGTLSALCLHRASGLLLRFKFSLIYLPLAVPDILMGISLLSLFVTLGVDLSLVTVILAHACFCTSYVAMVVLARLKTFDFTTLEAARDLGATPLQAGVRVLLPQLVPAMVSGGLLAFSLSVDDYVITFFVAGPGSTTLPLRVYSMIKHGSPPVINALSTLILAAGFLSVAWFMRFRNKETSP